MPEVALALWGLYGLLAVFGRAALQRRQTGSWGIHGLSGAAGSLEWLGGALFATSIGLGVLAPILDLNDALEPVALLDSGGVQVAGIVIFCVSFCALLAAQLAMGASWRIGVAYEERTELVTGGPFALVRNPIYSAMVPSVAGLALLVPNAVALAGLAALVASLEIQVRLVEEPHLLRAHDGEYRTYASRVGRFVPGIGRLRASGYF